MTLHRAHSPEEAVLGRAISSLPQLWRVVPLRHVIRKIESGVSVNATDVPAGPDDVAVLKTSSVYTGEFDINQTKIVADEDLGRVACPVAADRVIVSRMNTPALVGAAGYSESGAGNIYLPDRLWQVEFHGVNPRFVHKWTQTPFYRDQVSAVTAGTSASMHNLSQDDFKSFLIALPPADEQSAIVNFVEVHTAKIDLLIGKQERLIETLAERRQAVISHAVTKGLDPNAPMKDSGIEWLGMVPTSWAVKRIKHSVERAKNGVWGDDADGGSQDIWCVRVADFDRAHLAVSQETKTVRSVAQSDRVHRVLRRGDLLLEKSGGGEKSPVGFVALYDYDEPAVCSNFVARVKLATCMVPKFWVYVHAATYAVKLTQRSVKQTSGIQNLDQSSYFDERVAFPPEHEQIAIAEYLDRETSQIDALSAKAREMIDVLKERRQALISAAVTGKIDVRGLA